MKRVLGKLRERNDGEKKVISLVLSIALTFVIVSIWFSFSKLETSVNVIQESDIYANGPLKDLKEGFIKVIDSIK